ncbi:hypothetical protein BN1088_820003 [Sphingobacterium sp. PM2-P1-29]|nr:hypothetical protein BN1088_820003 [Sphingobacterium sp. PM2-P1-29]
MTVTKSSTFPLKNQSLHYILAKYFSLEIQLFIKSSNFYNSFS